MEAAAVLAVVVAVAAAPAAAAALAVLLSVLPIDLSMVDHSRRFRPLKIMNRESERARLYRRHWVGAKDLSA